MAWQFTRRSISFLCCCIFKLLHGCSMLQGEPKGTRRWSDPKTVLSKCCFPPGICSQCSVVSPIPYCSATGWESPAQVLSLWLGGECYEFTRPVPRLWARSGSAASVAGTVTSPMPGKVIKARIPSTCMLMPRQCATASMLASTRYMDLGLASTVEADFIAFGVSMTVPITLEALREFDRGPVVGA